MVLGVSGGRALAVVDGSEGSVTTLAGGTEAAGGDISVVVTIRSTVVAVASDVEEGGAVAV